MAEVGTSDKQSAILALRALADQLETNELLDAECAWRRDIETVENAATSNVERHAADRSVIVILVKGKGESTKSIPIETIALLMGFKI